MNEYHGPYTLWIVELDDTMGIRINETNSIRELISAKRSLFGILRYAKSVIYDKDSKEVNIEVPFVADGVNYDLTEGIGTPTYDMWLKGAN